MYKAHLEGKSDALKLQLLDSALNKVSTSTAIGTAPRDTAEGNEGKEGKTGEAGKGVAEAEMSVEEREQQEARKKVALSLQCRYRGRLCRKQLVKLGPLQRWIQQVEAAQEMLRGAIGDIEAIRGGGDSAVLQSGLDKVRSQHSAFDAVAGAAARIRYEAMTAAMVGGGDGEVAKWDGVVVGGGGSPPSSPVSATPPPAEQTEQDAEQVEQVEQVEQTEQTEQAENDTHKTVTERINRYRAATIDSADPFDAYETHKTVTADVVNALTVLEGEYINGLQRLVKAHEEANMLHGEEAQHSADFDR